jgi:hypothetical protein
MVEHREGDSLFSDFPQNRFGPPGFAEKRLPQKLFIGENAMQGFLIVRQLPDELQDRSYVRDHGGPDLKRSLRRLVALDRKIS